MGRMGRFPGESARAHARSQQAEGEDGSVSLCDIMPRPGQGYVGAAGSRRPLGFFPRPGIAPCRRMWWMGGDRTARCAVCLHVRDWRRLPALPERDVKRSSSRVASVRQCNPKMSPGMMGSLHGCRQGPVVRRGGSRWMMSEARAGGFRTNGCVLITLLNG